MYVTIWSDGRSTAGSNHIPGTARGLRCPRTGQRWKQPLRKSIWSRHYKPNTARWAFKQNRSFMADQLLRLWHFKFIVVRIQSSCLFKLIRCWWRSKSVIQFTSNIKSRLDILCFWSVVSQWDNVFAYLFESTLVFVHWPSFFLFS